MSEKFVSIAVDENGDVLDVKRVVQVGSGGTSRMVIDDSEIFRLDNLESEAGGRESGAPDRGDISKNGSNRISNLYRVIMYSYIISKKE